MKFSARSIVVGATLVVGALWLAQPSTSRAKDAESAARPVNMAKANSAAAHLSLELASSHDPVTVHALVLDSADVTTRAVSLVRKDADTIIATVPRTGNDGASKRLVALEVREQGTTEPTWSTVTSLDPKRADATALPLCAPTKVDISAMADQRATLDRLLEVRKKLQETYRAQLQTALSGKLLERIQNLEVHLGIEGKEKLSADLPAREIQARLSRVLAAAKAIKAQSAHSK